LAGRSVGQEVTATAAEAREEEGGAPEAEASMAAAAKVTVGWVAEAKEEHLEAVAMAPGSVDSAAAVGWALGSLAMGAVAGGLMAAVQRALAVMDAAVLVEELEAGTPAEASMALGHSVTEEVAARDRDVWVMAVAAGLAPGLVVVRRELEAHEAGAETVAAVEATVAKATVGGAKGMETGAASWATVVEREVAMAAATLGAEDTVAVLSAVAAKAQAMKEWAAAAAKGQGYPVTVEEAGRAPGSVEATTALWG
jgi:hypothetical protein